MSHPSAALVEHTVAVDWNVVAAAIAVFCGTLITTVWGWLTGKKKIRDHLRMDSLDIPITGAVIQDNQSLRESTLINKEVRDQLLIHHHDLQSSCKATDDNTRVLEEVLDELSRIRRLLEDRS